MCAPYMNEALICAAGERKDTFFYRFHPENIYIKMFPSLQKRRKISKERKSIDSFCSFTSVSRGHLAEIEQSGKIIHDMQNITITALLEQDQLFIRQEIIYYLVILGKCFSNNRVALLTASECIGSLQC